jgi:hypothetical protein
MAIQSDGKIVVAGNNIQAAPFPFVLVRYLTNGSPDGCPLTITAFSDCFGTAGSKGIVTAGFGGTSDDLVNALAIQSDGKIVVAGVSGNNFNDFAVARFTAGLIPKIAWPTPTAITYGTALTLAQLDATANVPGTFAYSLASGSVLGAGSQTSQ